MNLEARKKHVLTSYFNDTNKRYVKVFVSDMWEQYRDIAAVFFKNATQIVDKYHYLRKIMWAQDCQIECFNKCAATVTKWHSVITNSLVFHYSNGFTEGCNNRIKVLKRLAYGYTNFRLFRNRILHIFNNKNSTKFNEVAA